MVRYNLCHTKPTGPNRPKLYLLFAAILLLSCKNPSDQLQDSFIEAEKSNTFEEKVNVMEEFVEDYNPSDWRKVDPATSGIILDIRYAGINNFTGQVIYPCAACYLRPILANKLLEINIKLYNDLRWKLKVFDCYRPASAQQKLWDIVPNPNYVTPPEKGSMHNRGMAVDLTLVDEWGTERNMGTHFDYFGMESHTGYLGLSDEILGNRRVLQHYMMEGGFLPIRTEWWHFYYGGELYPISDWKWPCWEND
ncbi:MAG TPA: M15 family metallopeptidase [Saprospiraceae bacterium]|nr:M15 family metallopeptidase [Saprospiraceae bacterium]